MISDDATRKAALILAQTERYRGWQEIKRELEHLGHGNLDAVFDQPDFRRQIDSACRGDIREGSSVGQLLRRTRRPPPGG